MNKCINACKSILAKKTIILAISLAKTNFKLKNEGSYLGIFWYVLNPLMLFLTILFVKKSAFSELEVSMYPVYLLVGIVLFSYMNRSISMATGIIRSNSNFIKSVHVSTEALVMSGLLQVLFLHIFEMALIVFLALYVDISIIHLLLYVAVTALFSIFLLGVSFLFATLGVHIVDINNVWSAISHLLFFFTPIFYIADKTSTLYVLNQYNPLYYFITCARDVLIQGYTDSNIIVWSFVSAGVSLFFGIFIFAQHKRKFAEYL